MIDEFNANQDPSAELFRRDLMFNLRTADEVRELLAAGANPNAIENKYGKQRALHLYADDPEAVKALLEAGASPNSRSVDKQTPLTAAAQSGCPESCRLLIEAGADLKSFDINGLTALHWAAYVESPETFQLLITAGADPTAMNAAGETAVEIANNPEFRVVARNIVADHLAAQFEANTAQVPDRYRTDDWAPSPEAEEQGISRIREGLHQTGDEIQQPVRSRPMRL